MKIENYTKNNIKNEKSKNQNIKDKLNKISTTKSLIID